MGNAPGKIPEVANADVVDEVAPLGVDRRDAGRPVKHVGPLSLLVPVKLADAAGIEPHVHAGYRFRHAKLACRDLARPAAARLPDMGIRERKPQIGQCSGVSRRRVQEVRILGLADHVARDRIRAADAWSAAGLRRRFRGLSRRGGDHGAGGHRGRKNIPAREFAHSILPYDDVTLRSPSARVRQPVPAFLMRAFGLPRPRIIKRDGKETSTISVPGRVHFPRDAGAYDQ